MNVAITRRENNEVVVVYPINISELNYEATENHYFDEAWRNAIEDRIITDDQRQDYEFTLNE